MARKTYLVVEVAASQAAVAVVCQGMSSDPEVARFQQYVGVFMPGLCAQPLPTYAHSNSPPQTPH